MKKLEYYLVKFLYEILRHIPFSLSRYLAKLLAFFLHRVFRYRTDLVAQQLKSALPNLSEQKLKQITKEVYLNLASLFVEMLQSWRLNQDFFSKNFTIHNWNIVDQALKENKGFILLAGHLGNFEWPGSYLCSQMNVDVYAVMKPIHNIYINDLIVAVRKQLGFKLLYTKDAYKKGLRVLRQKNVLGVISDQDARKNGIFVDFFGMPASTAKGLALLHLRTGAPMLMITGIRRAWGKYDIYFERVPSSDDVIAITQAHTQILEKWIRKYPGQYFWTHKRWKTKPCCD